MTSNRRQFLWTTATGLAGTLAAARALTQSACAEQTGKYQGPIIDTHTHFYDPTRPHGVPWPPQNDKVLYRRVLPADYKALPKPQAVTATVVVEASPWVEDNQWILDLAAKEPFIVGFIGNLAAGAEDFRTNLARFSTNQLFRGVRIGADRLRLGLPRARFIDDMKSLASRDLVLDVLGGTDMLGDVARLADAVPQVRMIIDHAANVRVDGKPPDDAWRNGLRAAAAHENVFCKMSGLVEGTGRTDGNAPRQVDYYRPVLDVLWETFGESRLVYGSNWPVSERFAPCSVVQSIVADYLAGKGGSAPEKVLFKNSQQCYKWIARKSG